MTETPLISSIIPVYNGAHFLAEAIESILAQSYGSQELIVLDDGSTDETSSVAEQFGSAIRYHYQSNQGLGAARNAAIGLARADFFAFLDADDLWSNDKLSLQMQALADDPSLDMVGGFAENFFNPGLAKSFREKIRCPMTPQPAPVVPAMPIRRRVFERAGMFETTWKVGADLDWFLRAKEKNARVSILPEVVLRRRIHETNTGIVNNRYANQRLHILKAALDRRRESTNKANGSRDDEAS